MSDENKTPDPKSTPVPIPGKAPALEQPLSAPAVQSHREDFNKVDWSDVNNHPSRGVDFESKPLRPVDTPKTDGGETPSEQSGQ
jgi:hypothetical protein